MPLLPCSHEWLNIQVSFRNKMFQLSTMPRTEPFAEKNFFWLAQDGHGLQVQPSSLKKKLHMPRVPCNHEWLNIQVSFRNKMLQLSTRCHTTVKNFFRGKKTSTCAGWSWTAGPTFVFGKKTSHTACTL